LFLQFLPKNFCCPKFVFQTKFSKNISKIRKKNQSLFFTKIGQTRKSRPKIVTKKTSKTVRIFLFKSPNLFWKIIIFVTIYRSRLYKFISKIFDNNHIRYIKKGRNSSGDRRLNNDSSYYALPITQQSHKMSEKSDNGSRSSPHSSKGSHKEHCEQVNLRLFIL